MTVLTAIVACETPETTAAFDGFAAMPGGPYLPGLLFLSLVVTAFVRAGHARKRMNLADDPWAHDVNDSW